ncbi:type I secretion system permease/ATPase [Amylibacter sp.]|nr:type I secretion system permease/ATPase [Amylibacter sp.]
MVSKNNKFSDENTSKEINTSTDEAITPQNEPNANEKFVDVSGNFSEASLLCATQYILANSGMAFSLGAIRDLPEKVGEVFDPTSAVSALTHVGFNASYGEFPLRKFTKKHLPAIGFTSNGDAVLISSIESDRTFVTYKFDEEGNNIEVSYDYLELNKILVPYVIIAQKKPNMFHNEKKNDWFWSSMLQGKWLYGQVFLASTVINFLALASSLFIMTVYNTVVPNSAIESLISLTIGVLIALSFDFIIKTLRGQFIDRAGKLADLRMSRLIFDKLLNMRIDFRTHQSGAMSSIVREFDTLREFFTSATLVAVVDLPYVFLFVWVIHLIAGPLAIVPLIAIPAVIVSGLIIQPFLAKIADSVMNSNMSKQSILVETLNGIETIQVTGSGRLMRKRFEEAANAQSELGFKNRLLSQFAINSSYSIQQLSMISTVVYGVFLLQDNIITMGSMIAAVILGGRTLAPLSQMAAAMTRAHSARQAYKKISELMASDKGNAPDGMRARLSRPHFNGDIELKNVSYSFPGSSSPIIDNLSLKITAGQKVAFVGRMGSGKSTITRLIAGLIEPSEGSVLIDGVDLRQIDKSDVRRNIGVMLQETWLFSGTIKENLQMGYYEYDDAHMLKIAKFSGVDSFISNRPEGYDLELKEKGEGLSGGQRQSINLARSLLHEPNLLVLDEPTSSMDTTSEKAVISCLKSWPEEKTILIVTHRNSLLDIVNRILVIDDGKILADTTPEKLNAER